jgi:hypothetical protein
MRGAFLIILALLGACSREPDFDEQFEAASKQIGTKARKIDREMEQRAQEAPKVERPIAPSPENGTAKTP